MVSNTVGSAFPTNLQGRGDYGSIETAHQRCSGSPVFARGSHDRVLTFLWSSTTQREQNLCSLTSELPAIQPERAGTFSIRSLRRPTDTKIPDRPWRATWDFLFKGRLRQLSDRGELGEQKRSFRPVSPSRNSRRSGATRLRTAKVALLNESCSQAGGASVVARTSTRLACRGICSTAR
jgi:hypothetical protein